MSGQNFYFTLYNCNILLILMYNFNISKQGNIMIRQKTTSLFLLMMLLLVTDHYVLGIVRSKGIGVRGGGWSLKEPPEYSTSGVSTSGMSGHIFFFSRYQKNWFLEASIGGVSSTMVSGIVESETVTPFLFGPFYNLFSSRKESHLQPYVGAGLGAYLINRSVVGGSVRTENDTDLGLYLSSGVNIMLGSRLAINGDFKYHIVDINTESGRDYNGIEYCIGLSYMWGKKREMFLIEEIKVVVKDIYPAYYQFYTTYPLALVSIKNTVDYPIEVNVHSNIEGFSERSHESGFVQIERNETKDIPVLALLGPKLLQVSRREPAVLDLKVQGRAGATLVKSISARVVIHNRNAWNGEIDRLRFFVTPEDELILKLSRGVVNQMTSVDVSETKKFFTAKALFNELKKSGIRYQADPNIPFYKDDRVQFATETTELSTGDCDDLVVLYSSLLESVGLKTAFVDVQNPEKEIAHVYLIFDSGLSPKQGELISSNEKRFIIRENSMGNNTLWIPVETTLIETGFDKAWKAGALQFLQEGIIREGLKKGWVKIIDVH